MGQVNKLVSIDDAADRLDLKTRTLQDRRYRERIGLAWVKIGQRVKFVDADLSKFIDDRRQGAGRSGR